MRGVPVRGGDAAAAKLIAREGYGLKTYWVYEDDPTKQACVHIGECSHCNHGQGKKRTRHSDNRWHGPFRTREDVIQKALSTPARDVRGCGHCLKSVGALR